ncbi:MAG: ABC transporter permease [Pseudomonadota bacterium]
MDRINKIIELLAVAMQGIVQHRLRSGLSILGIICGVMAVLTMMSVGEGAKHELLKQIERLGTNTIHVQEKALTDSQKKEASAKLSLGLTQDDARRLLAACASINAIALVKEIRAEVIGLPADETPLILAVSPSYAAIMDLVISQGRFIQDMDVREHNMVCVIGDRLAQRLGRGGLWGEGIRVGGHLFKVIGRIRGDEPKTGEPAKTIIAVRDYSDLIIIPSGLESLFMGGEGNDGLPGGSITEMIVQVRLSSDVLSTGSAVRRVLDTAHHQVPDFQVIIPQALLAQARKTQGLFNLVLGAIAGVSLLVGGIGIMNIMLATVSERTREIGLRRAVGATQGHIVGHFLMESVLLTFTGGVVGVVLGCGVSVGVSAMGQWQTRITLWAILAPVIMAVLVGVFFGLYPAVKASRMDPIKALRFE